MNGLPTIRGRYATKGTNEAEIEIDAGASAGAEGREVGEAEGRKVAESREGHEGAKGCKGDESP
jgi:hypothetical protein